MCTSQQSALIFMTAFTVKEGHISRLHLQEGTIAPIELMSTVLRRCEYHYQCILVHTNE